jgi:DNA-binding response OmpR family regulator
MRILVAEDEKNILLMFKLFLEDEGFDVVTSANGQECMDAYHCSIIENSPFDVVILDYKMPKKDGKQVAREILLVNPSQTIIMITAFPQEMTSFEELKIVRILRKPFEPDDLIALLKSLDSAKNNPAATTSITALT